MEKKGISSACTLDSSCTNDSKTSIVGAKVMSNECQQGNKPSKVINLKFKNGHGTETKVIVLGTPLGLAGEIQFYDSIKTQLENGGAVLATNDVNTSIDNLGIRMKFLQGLNEQLNRRGIFISRIEVITKNNTLGQTQAGEQLRKITIPLNYANEQGIVENGDFVAQDTFNTGVELLCNSGVAINGNSGIAYNVLPGAEVKFNIYIDSYDMSVMKTV